MTVTIILTNGNNYILEDVINISKIGKVTVLTFSDGKTTSYQDATVSVNLVK